MELQPEDLAGKRLEGHRQEVDIQASDPRLPPQKASHRHGQRISLSMAGTSLLRGRNKGSMSTAEKVSFGSCSWEACRPQGRSHELELVLSAGR